LEVAERLEGKIMRKMRTEMKLMEDRLLLKMEQSLAEMREDIGQNNSRLSGAIAPMVQCIATEHMELRTIAPMVQCIATEHMELQETVRRLITDVSIDKAQPSTAAAHEIPASSLTPTGTAMEPHQPASNHDGAACVLVLKDMDELERELQEECAAQAAHDCNSQCDDLQALQEEVANLKDVCPQFLKPAADLSKRAANTAKLSFDGPDLWMKWTAQPVTSFPYSSKIKGVPSQGNYPGRQWSCSQMGNQDLAPFAPGGAPTQLYSAKQVFGCRSCPVLPPLQ
jgi:hypothetical protein